MTWADIKATALEAAQVFSVCMGLGLTLFVILAAMGASA